MSNQWMIALARLGLASVTLLATNTALADDGGEDVASGAAAVAPTKPKASTSIVKQFAMSAGATAMLAPAVYSTARVVGTSTGNLNTSALPALLIAAIVPPAIATGAILFERRREGAGAPARFFPTYFYALGAQVLVLTGALFAQTWVADPKDLILLSLATGAALGGAATLGAEISF